MAVKLVPERNPVPRIIHKAKADGFISQKDATKIVGSTGGSVDKDEYEKISKLAREVESGAIKADAGAKALLSAFRQHLRPR